MRAHNSTQLWLVKNFLMLEVRVRTHVDSCLGCLVHNLHAIKLGALLLLLQRLLRQGEGTIVGCCVDQRLFVALLKQTLEILKHEHRPDGIRLHDLGKLLVRPTTVNDSCESDVQCIR